MIRPKRPAAPPGDAASATLSTEEISAVLDGFDRSTIHAVIGGDSGSIVPHTLGQSTAAPLGGTPMIARNHQRIAQQLRLLIEPIMRARVAVRAVPMVTRAYSDWVEEQPAFACLSLHAIPPLPGTIMLAIQPEMVRAMLDCTYGGTGTLPPSGSVRELTATEDNLFARLSDAIIQVIATVWNDASSPAADGNGIPANGSAQRIVPHLRGREHILAYATIARGDDPVAVGRFMVDFADGTSAGIDLVLPAMTLAAIDKQLLPRRDDGPACASSDWRQRLHQAAEDIRFDARTVLARPELMLGDLLRIAVGDIIPVAIPAASPLIVEEQTVAFGTIGEREGQAALMISRIDNRG